VAVDPASPVEVTEDVSSDPEPEAQARKTIPRRAEERTGVMRGMWKSMGLLG
jgi:hypothetical protein